MHKKIHLTEAHKQAHTQHTQSPSVYRDMYVDVYTYRHINIQIQINIRIYTKRYKSIHTKKYTGKDIHTKRVK